MVGSKPRPTSGKLRSESALSKSTKALGLVYGVPVARNAAHGSSHPKSLGHSSSDAHLGSGGGSGSGVKHVSGGGSSGPSTAVHATSGSASLATRHTDGSGAGRPSDDANAPAMVMPPMVRASVCLRACVYPDMLKRGECELKQSLSHLSLYHSQHPWLCNGYGGVTAGDATVLW